MSEYRAIYKCRLCGGEFTKFVTEFSYDANLYIMPMCLQNQRNNLPFESHICPNGDIGFADFLGFRKVEDGNESD